MTYNKRYKYTAAVITLILALQMVLSSVVFADEQEMEPRVVAETVCEDVFYESETEALIEEAELAEVAETEMEVIEEAVIEIDSIESEEVEAPAFFTMFALPAVNSIAPLSLTNTQRQDNIKVIFNYAVTNMGLNSAAACGLLANAEAESDFDPTCGGDGGTSYGLFQWHASRKTAMIDWCTAKGLDYNSASAQMAYLKYELETDSYYSYVLDYLKNVPNTAQGAYDAAYYFCVKYEVPAYKETKGANRGADARDVYWPQYGSSTGTGMNGWDSAHTSFYVNGKKLTGFQTIDGNNYYFNASGIMVKGQQKIDGKWYLFYESSGIMARNEFVAIAAQNKTVYYGSNGQMVYGQQKINNRWYYFDTVTGKMASKQFITIASQNKTVYYNENGYMVYGQQKIDGHWCYFDTVTGKMAKSQFITIASQNKTVYYNENGYMVYGQQKIDGHWCYFDTVTGKMAKSQFITIASQNKTVYYNENGYMVYGQQKIDGHWYYFDVYTGKMAISQFVEIKSQNKTVYYNANGYMLYGEQVIDGELYYFNTRTGALEDIPLG